MTRVESDGMAALQAVDFQWTVHVDSVWSDPEYHVPALHSAIRDEILYELEDMATRKSSGSSLGRVVTGAGGVGKTHLIRTLRMDAAARGAGFVFVDMTGVQDFWSTILQSYLDSLQRPYIDGIPQYAHLLEHLIDAIIEGKPVGRGKLKLIIDGVPQYARLFEFLINAIVGKPVGREELRYMATAGAGKAVQMISAFLSRLTRRHRHEVLKYQDTIRALFLLRSDDLTILNIGYSWLQGSGIEQKDKERYGFEDIRKEPQEIVEALSWLMALKSPVILALDQMDSIVAQHHLVARAGVGEPDLDEQMLSLSIIEGIGGGLSALRDVTSRTLVVVSCLESTWEIIRETLSTNADRYNEPVPLKKLGRNELAMEMVIQRLCDAYRKSGFRPEYASWPYKPEAFGVTGGMLPRQILQNCERHRRRCLARGEVMECETLDMS